MNLQVITEQLMQVLPIIGILSALYFIIIRPQQKKVRNQQLVLTLLKSGDRVVTSGGIFGTIESIQGMEVGLKIAPDVVIQVQKSSLSTIELLPQNVEDMTTLESQETPSKKKTLLSKE